jgi:hypothetical protein
MAWIVARPGLISSRSPGWCKQDAQELKALGRAREHIERVLDASQGKAGESEMLEIYLESDPDYRDPDYRVMSRAGKFHTKWASNGGRYQLVRSCQ